MKRAFLSLLPVGLGLSAMSAVHLGNVGLLGTPGEPKAPVATLLSSGSVAAPFTDEGGRAAVRQRLRSGESGTYISEILGERDSSLARWPDRHGRPLAVWIQPISSVHDWSPGYVDSVRSAFADWDTLAIPVHFAFVNDSARADVHVTWIDHFSEPISGRTKWARDDNWWITDADIQLAVHHNRGEVLDQDAMKAMALHEIGHLLGLDHTRDATSIMAAKVRVRELSPADRATIRLLYSLPPGAVGG